MNNLLIDEYYTDEYYDIYPENDYRTYLQHYGVQGQKWGKRNAEWYPIADWQAHLANTKGQEEARSFGDRVKAAYKAHKKNANLKKARKVKARKAANAHREELRQVRSEAKKQKILRGGTPGDIIRIRSQLTDQEIADAVARNNNINRLREAENTRLQQISDAEWEKKYGKYRKFFDAIKKGASVTSDVANAIDKVNNIVNPKQPKKINPLDVLAHPERFTNDEVKEAKDRAENMKNIKNSLNPKKEATFEEILTHPENFTTDEVTAANRKAQAVKNGQNALDELNKRSVDKNTSPTESTKSDTIDADHKDIIDKVDKDTLNTPMSEVKNKTYSYDEALEYWLENQSGSEQKRTRKQLIKDQDSFAKEFSNTFKKTNANYNKLSHIKQIEDSVTDDLLLKFADNESNKIDSEDYKKTKEDYKKAKKEIVDRLLGSKHKNLSTRVDTAVESLVREKTGFVDYEIAYMKERDLRIDVDEEEKFDGIPKKENPKYKELQAAKKETVRLKKVYENNIKNIRSNSEHSDREREIAAKVREDGYASLTDVEKEIFNDAYR